MAKITQNLGRLFRREPKLPTFPVDETPSLAPVAVEFAISQKQVVFDPQRHETLLDVADEAGVFVPACCRAGVDGVCEVEVLEGDVVYLQAPGVEPMHPKGCLICIAVPKSPIKLGV